MDSSGEPTEAEVEAVIAEFGGDLRAVIHALLHDLAMLATDFTASVSNGYVRGRASHLMKRHLRNGPVGMAVSDAAGAAMTSDDGVGLSPEQHHPAVWHERRN